MSEPGERPGADGAGEPVASDAPSDAAPGPAPDADAPPRAAAAPDAGDDPAAWPVDDGRDPRPWLAAIVGVSLVANAISAGFTNPIYADAIFWSYPMAKALAAGDLAAGLDIAVPPGHPALIALFHAVGAPIGLAGSGLSVLCGALIALPLYLIGRRLGGPRVGIALAALGTLQPTIVKYAGEVKSEIVLALFLLLAVERALALVQQPGPLRAAAFGALVGVAYLVKPEGYGLLMVVSLWLLLAQATAPGRRLAAIGRGVLCVAVAGAVFYGVALANVANVHARTGVWSLSNKGPITLTNRVAKDPVLPQALTPDHTEVRLHAQIYRGDCLTETSFAAMVRREPGYHAKRIASNLGEAFSKLPESMGFYPLPFLLVALLAARRRRWRWRLEGLPAFVTFAYLCAFSLLWVARRMLVPITPLAIVWPAIGWVVATDWLAARKPALAPLRHPAVVIGVAALIALIAAARIATKGDFRWNDGPGRTAAAWMNENLPDLGPQTKVMADPGDVAYYTGTRYVFFPTDATAPTLTFARHKGVRYLALDAGEDALWQRRVFVQQVTDDPPPGLVRLATVEDGEARITIYRLDSP